MDKKKNTIKRYLIIFFILIVLVSMERNFQNFESPPFFSLQEIEGRDHSPLYQIKVPMTWIWKTPLPKESLEDTKKALFEVIIYDPQGKIRVTIHNFPVESLENQIPVAAQIARWERQFSSLEQENTYTTPQSFSGYVGTLFHGVGLVQNEDFNLETVVSRLMMLGWVLQLGKEHYQTLHYNETPRIKEICSDVTIKAVGPYFLMEKYKRELIAMARSFELIEEIPGRL